MNTRARLPLLDPVITVVLVLLVFFVSYLFDGPRIFGEIMATAFFIAFYYYYRKSKSLEKQLASWSPPGSKTPTSPPEEGIAPPLSTDA